MKVGDIVKRKIKGPIDFDLEKKTGKFGIILKKPTPWAPKALCITVFYPQSGKVYSISESLVEVINESR